MKNNKLFIYRYENLDLEIKPFFSNYRLNKINLSNNPKVIKRMIETEYVLYYLLKPYLGNTDFEFNIIGNGRPVLNKDNLYFSISHSNDYLVVAIGNTNISVDIEYIDNKRLKIKDKLYNDSTNKAINDVIKDFTLKEAFIKYFSSSITVNLKTININDKFVYDNLNKLRYQSFKFNDYYISVLKENEFNLEIKEIMNFNCLLKDGNYNKIY